MTIKNFIQAVNTFHNNSNDDNSRYRSWEYCYQEFSQARKNGSPDYDYLSLHLAFYLASWGMLRASFLLQKDYKIHIPAIKIILNQKYDILQGLKCQEFLKPEVQALWQDLNDELLKYYGDVRKTVKGEVKQGISSVLLTKILLGTLGCVPAYDRFFIQTAKEFHITGTYGIRSLKELAKFYQDNEKELEKLRQSLNKNFEYPQMKLLDMGFWQLGFEKDTQK